MRLTDAGVGGRGEVKSDINVTPLVSVLLVLLIIMMVATPMVNPGVDVKLPRAANTIDKRDPELAELPDHETSMTVVTITANKGIYLNYHPVREEELTQKVTESVESKKDKTVLIRGDEDTPYSAMLAVMDRLRAAQIGNITLAVEKRVNRPGDAGERR